MANTARIDLEMGAAGGEVRGVLHQRGAQPRPFIGWLELTAAVEAARAGAPTGPAGRPEPAPRGWWLGRTLASG